MKTSQRTFVVEIRNGRRQSKARANSIWGDTDLKAIASEVAGGASHPFGSHLAPRLPDEGVVEANDKSNAAAVSETGVGAGEDVISSVEPAGAEAPHQGDADVPAAEAIAHVPASEPASEPQPLKRGPRGTTKRGPAHAIALIGKRSNADQIAQNTMDQAAGSFEELDALDLENKRLKNLLAERLHRENLQLKRMLEQFEVR